MFHVLADSNRKEESDRIEVLTWLQERFPLAMIDHVTAVCRILRTSCLYLSGMCVAQRDTVTVVFGVLFKEFQICKKVIRIWCSAKI